jgi:myo-inositol-1(or 4)-monophosphatase
MTANWQATLSRALRVSEEAARAAGDHIMGEFRRLSPAEVEEKGPHDFVTRVDHEADKLIVDRLRKEFPDHKIVAEESGGSLHHTGGLWLVDPLDGTTNFIHGFPMFCVSVAFAIEGRTEVGTIYDPVHGEMFACKRDEGMWLNSSPVSVSQVNDLSRAFVGTGFASRYKKELGPWMGQLNDVCTAVSGIRKAGAAALDLAYVACGRFDAFWEPHLSAWDMAAGSLMVEAAGGRVSDEAGNPWKLGSRGIIAANADLHAPLVSILNRP